MASFRIIDPVDEQAPLVVTPLDQLGILVIDDSAVSLDLIEGCLQSISVGRVRKASSVFAAAGILADTTLKTDCIICDHHMEGMTGLAFLQRIRAGRNTIVPRDLRFIVITGDASEPVVRAAVELDVNGFISKPITVNAVTKAVQLALGRPTRLKAAADYARVVVPASPMPASPRT